jgi:hypothetical protein
MFFSWSNPPAFGSFPKISPRLQTGGGHWALDLLHTLWREELVPPQVPEWHFDDIHACFLSGHAAIADIGETSVGKYEDVAGIRVGGCHRQKPSHPVRFSVLPS